MKAAEEDPKHAEWWLERKHPERWGRKERHELTGAGGGTKDSAPTSADEALETLREIAHVLEKVASHGID